MKNLASRLSGMSSVALAALSIVLTLLVVTLLSVLVILPSFNSITSASGEIELAKSKAASIDQTVALLNQEDQETLKQLISFLELYVPEKIDDLHFATLNEAVAAAAGVTVSSIQISKGAVGASTPPPQAPVSGEGATTTPPVQVAQPSVSVTYSSDFNSLLNLISFWSLADQLVGIKELNISGVAGQTIDYTIDYQLPTSGPAQVATIEDRLSLTKEQKDRLLKIKENITYTATPSANTVGKSNPFN